jgi:pimeloyl-ACP methyl ester carboxylesterase
MLKKLPIQIADLRAYNRLAIDATLGLTDLVENLHHNVARLPSLFGAATDEPTRGITGFVYRSIRGVTRTVGDGIDGLLGVVTPSNPRTVLSERREALLAALNGVVGDHLVASGNPLAIPMQFRRDGQALSLTRSALAEMIPEARSRIVILVHGLCMSDLQFTRHGHDHGAALAEDEGVTPVYLHYNSGLHISSNGREFSELLEKLCAEWPVDVREISIIGYSMGGLITRSACAHARRAQHAWLEKLTRIFFLGTPHAGSPLERTGQRLHALLGASPYTAALSRLAKVRSAGITDLRYASLSDADWQDYDRFSTSVPPYTRVPLPAGVQCYALAGSIAKKAGALRERLIGDGLVPVESALGIHDDPKRHLGLVKSRQFIAYGASHLGLLESQDIYERIRSAMRARVRVQRARVTVEG